MKFKWPWTKSQRPPRAGLLPLSHVHLELSGDQSIRLANLSIGGLGAIKSSFFLSPEVGAEIDGHLMLHETDRISIRLKVVRNEEREDIVGCMFLSPSRELVDKIQTFFDIELKAATLKKISEIQERDGTAYSFEGKDGAELSYVYSDSGLMKFLCIFFGHRVEWSKNSAIKVDSSKQEETLKLGRRFVQSIEGLDPDHKARLIDLLKG